MNGSWTIPEVADVLTTWNNARLLRWLFGKPLAAQGSRTSFAVSNAFE